MLSILSFLLDLDTKSEVWGSSRGHGGGTSVGVIFCASIGTGFLLSMGYCGVLMREVQDGNCNHWIVLTVDIVSSYR
jgi:hypothetical protein